MKKPPLLRTPTTAEWWQAADAQHLLVQTCNRCGEAYHYPRRLCPTCWSAETAWVTCTGLATVVTFSVIHRPGHPAWEDEAPYCVAIVQLDEGPRLMSRIVGWEQADLAVGARARAESIAYNESQIPAFRII